MSLHVQHVGFLRYLFGISYNGGRLERSRFRREDLLTVYREFCSDIDGFSEAMDSLVFEKMLAMEASPSRLFVEYYLTRKAVEFLAASNENDLLPLTVDKLTLTPEQKDLLVNDIGQALKRVDELDLGQERRSQIRSLLLAAQALSEAPQPPINIIKMLLSDVDRMINVAGFFVGVAGLILGLL